MNRRLMLVAVVLTSLPVAALAQESSGGDSSAPGGMTVGVGVGYQFSTAATPATFSILTPNTASVRLRMGALTLEPMITLTGSNGSTTDKMRTDAGGTVNETTTSTTNGGFGVGLAGNVLYEMANAGPMSFHVIGGLAFGYASATAKAAVTAPITEDSNTVTATTAGLTWGLAVEWAFTKNLVMSAEATNPLVTWTDTKTVRHVGTNAPSTADVTHEVGGFTGGLTFAPNVFLLFHLYF